MNSKRRVLELLKLERFGKKVSISKSLVSLLCELANDDDVSVAKEAVAALGYVRSEVVMQILLESLDDKSRPEMREAAAQALGQQNDERAVEPLIAALENDIDIVKKRAAEALGLLGGEQAVVSLINVLQGSVSVEWRVLESVTLALGKLGDSRAVEPLVAAMKNNGLFWDVRKRAAESLSSLGWNPQDKELAALSLAFRGEYEECTRLGKPAIDALIECIYDEEALEAFGLMSGLRDERIFKILTRSLYNPIDTDATDWERVVIAIEAIGKQGDARYVDELIELIYENPPWKVQAKAIEVLGNIGDLQDINLVIEHIGIGFETSSYEELINALRKQGEMAISILIESLNDKDMFKRSDAAYALGEFGDENAVKPLITALNDEDYEVRVGAADSLGVLGDIQAVNPLINLLSDEDSKARAAAAESLGELGDLQAVDPLVILLGEDDDSAVIMSTSWALGQLGDERAVEPLIAALYNENIQVRETIIKALVKIGIEKVLGPLIATLISTPDWRVRESAVKLLGELKDARALKVLIKALRDSDNHVRKSAAHALGQLGDTQAVEPLITTLSDNDKYVRARAAHALGRLVDFRAIEPLIAALKDDEWNVREGVAQALGQLGDERAVDPLITALFDGESVVGKSAAEALGAIKDLRAVKPLIIALKRFSGGSKETVIKVLGKLRDPRAVQPLILLIKEYDDHEYEEDSYFWGKEELTEAIYALGLIGDSRAVQPLINVLKNYDMDIVKNYTIEALYNIGTPKALAAVREYEGD